MATSRLGGEVRTLACLGGLLLLGIGVGNLQTIVAEVAKPAGAVAANATPPSPSTWPVGQVIFEQSEAAKKIRAALRQPTDVDFHDAKLGDVAKFLEKTHGIAIVLDNEALAADGKGEETPITRSLRETTLENALAFMLDGQALAIVVKNDVLHITTKAAAAQPENLSTRVYQVHDLVVAANDPTASQPDFDSLIDVVTGVVRQADWQDNGGAISFIRPYAGPGLPALIVPHDERGHREIEDLLKSLRAARLGPIFDAQTNQPFARRPKQTPPNGWGVGGENVDPDPAVHSKPEAAKNATDAPSATPAKAQGGGFF